MWRCVGRSLNRTAGGPRGRRGLATGVKLPVPPQGRQRFRWQRQFVLRNVVEREVALKKILVFEEVRVGKICTFA